MIQFAALIRGRARGCFVLADRYFSAAPVSSVEALDLLYYRRFPGDYANDTRHLTFAEHGAYTLLLDYCYASENPLPKDKNEIYRKICARTAEERAAVDIVLAEFFKPTRRGFVQGRVKEEIARTKRKSEARRISGRKGGLKRQANAKQLLSKTQASQTLDSRLQTPDPETSLPSFVIGGNGGGRASYITEREDFARAQFEIFWVAYPKQLDRDDAYKLWLAMNPIDQQKAVESISLWTKSEEWSEPRFVPSPVTFIKKRRWESKPVQKKKGENLYEQAKAIERKYGID